MRLKYSTALLLIIFFVTLVKADQQLVKDTALMKTDEQLVKDTTDVVARFYEVLLQKEEPTVAQENELFDHAHCGIKVAIGDKLKIPETEPGILQVFRKNKELFLPAGMRSKKEIIISSPFQLVRNLVEYKDKGNSSYEIIVLMADRGPDDLAHSRTVIFSVTGGKINPDSIRTKAADGPMTLELVLESKLPNK